MGSALLGYRKFEECGLKIVAAFDSDPAKIGRKIHGKHVLALDKLADLAQRMHVLIGIITVRPSRRRWWRSCSWKEACAPFGISPRCGCGCRAHHRP